MAQTDSVSLRIPNVERPARAMDDCDLMALELALHLRTRGGIDPQCQQKKTGRVAAKRLVVGLAGARFEREESPAGNPQPDRPQPAIFPVMPAYLG